MTILIKKATIVQPGNKNHLKKKDILIKNGKISKIAAAIPESGAKVVSCKNLHISPGWLDLRANFRDPGHEYKEGLLNGLKAATQGGFTGVVTMPSTNPVVDNQSAVQYLKSNSSNSACEVFPAGSISQGLKGNTLSEFYDMTSSGAVAFTEDTKFLGNTNLLSKALEYSKTINSLVYSFPYDPHLVEGGQMHEGKTSTMLGMRGIPAVSEEIQLARDIKLLEHFGGRLHVVAISSANSVQLIKDAKKAGLNITCSVHSLQLCFNDEDVNDFDSRYKVLPPFRTEKDKKALIKGLKDGTIDAICSGHEPEDVEEKKKEFTEAAFGISAIEIAYSAVQTALKGELTPEQVCEKFSSNPREIIGKASEEIATGNKANVTLFDPTLKWEFNRDKMVSKSKNSPYDQQEFTGKVIGVVNRGKVSLSF